MPVQAKEEPQELYAQSAVLMDAESGRVLFSKNGDDVKAMASTTKIMTCIVALEQNAEDMTVVFSERAQKQPKVHLGANAGEEFLLRDLLYSLMLESHNDVAVAIAEAVAGSVEAFANLMNEKAKEIGCEHTYFITPNGLDASDENGVHSTTAVELAKIMSYCILKSPKKDEFLKITQTSQYSFSNAQGTRSYSCTNHNAFLTMMDEAISGKTGFTGDAGYCYVGAVESDGRTFVVALLACGWPNNKTYKWKDMRKLAEYGLQNYQYQSVENVSDLDGIEVENGVPKSGGLSDEVIAKVHVEGELKSPFLLHKEEMVDIHIIQEDILHAPVKKGQQVGEVTYSLDGKVLASLPIVTTESVNAKDYPWYFQRICEMFLL